MAQPVRDGKIILNETEGNAKFMEGAKAAYDIVTTTFGPKGKNVRLEKIFGRPILSRDGVTVAREVYFSDRAKNMGAQALLEASETTNRIAGDGTTLTVALSYNLLLQGEQAIAAGTHPMQVAADYRADEAIILEHLATLSKPTKPHQLKEVATVSSGDPILGELIAEAIDRVGADGGVMVEKAPLDDVEREYIDGYYIQSGFQALLGGRKEMLEPLVIVLGKRVASSADIGEILTRSAAAKGLTPGKDPFKFLIIGNLEDAAYNHVVQLINAQQLDAIIIKTPPSFGDMGSELLEDIAIYANCSVITDGIKAKQVGLMHIGTIDRVSAGKTEATLFSDNTTERVQVRAQGLKDQLAAEISDAVSERLRDRIAKLEGKIALFKIGGATDTEKEEKEFRVEDALQSSRAAVRFGVVPGGGVTLIELSRCSGLSDAYKLALRNTIKRLFTNADPDNAEVMLKEALAAPKGHGFNLREDTADAEVIDITKAGIIDPTLVVEEAVRNATSVAAENLKVGSTSIFENDTTKTEPTPGA